KSEAKLTSLQGLDGERHLVVLVDHDWPGGAGLVLDEPEVPHDAPILPKGITDIWMATVRSLVWHFSEGSEGWEVISSVQKT
ncbi:MAG TPA: hypothetical protein VE569_02035, partial [Acidimicrobiia bacterium]|nr:hypothetical protein [Acidimicrobiia bacterium]